MRVTLAYPFDGHEPDETVDLPDADARRLLNDGKARLPRAESDPEPTPSKPTPKKRGSGRRTSKEQ